MEPQVQSARRPSAGMLGLAWGGLAFLAGGLIGMCVWLAAPRLIGEVEPWDWSLWGYVSIMVGAGFAVAYVAPVRLAPAGALGLYFGQLLYVEVLYQPRGPLILPLFLSVALLGLVPACAGAGTRVLLHWLAVGRRR
jgi:hypothetical protein